jgi:hypothetical protein
MFGRIQIGVDKELILSLRMKRIVKGGKLHYLSRFWETTTICGEDRKGEKWADDRQFDDVDGKDICKRCYELAGRPQKLIFRDEDVWRDEIKKVDAVA